MTKEIKYAQKLQAQYGEHQPTKLEELKNLDSKVKQPVQIFAYVFGSVGSLVLGTGMSLAMKIIGNSMILGILIGVVGIAMVSVNYFIYKKLLDSRKKKYANEVLALSNEILNEK
ncbi:MAG: dihydropteridine reductase [Clostridia bacterium]|nr:dihydropteridine reductase [Clostridia bacterium]